MKTNIGENLFPLSELVIFISIFLVLSCASTSVNSLEGNDFNKNLIGLWDGNWHFGNMSGKQHIKITGIDGNKVHLTGFAQGGGTFPEQDEVNGRIENSTLLLTWPISGTEEKYKMKRDNSNNLILDGHWKANLSNGRVQLKKIE
jgi:hypothetical protein